MDGCVHVIKCDILCFIRTNKSMTPRHALMKVLLLTKINVVASKV